MYGMINKAIQELVCSRFGEKAWQDIKQKAEIQTDTFLSMEAYPDDLTHRLIVAASQVLGISTASVMQAFGEFWVSYTSKEGYGDMMDMVGDTLPEFLENLDELHARVGINFPKLVPPSFQCHSVEENQLELHYHSSRSGLAPMVTGLVKGLGQKFDTEVKITQTTSREQGDKHDAFVIEYKPN